MRALSSFVAGEWRAGGERAEDLNPARPSEVVAETSLADASVTADAIAAAEAAFPAWSALPPPRRGEILRKAADVLDRATEEVGRDLAREEGKTLPEAIAETQRAVAVLRYFAGQTLEPDGEVYPSHSPATFLYARREPIGVVVAITPWNFPIAIPAWKLAPALAYGNCVVWKPAELVPLTGVHLLQAFREAGVPEGVLNLVVGRGSTIGDALVTDERVAAITFTGSNAVGRSIQRKALEHGAKVQLELGGKNPAVVLADANLEQAADQVARGAFLSAGQKCTATSRVIVERPVLEELGERLTEHAQSWTLGDPLDERTTIGPLASREQLETVGGYLDLARSDAATILAGGERATELGEGYFVRPTVLTDVPRESKVVREEIFGPVAALLPADSYDEALALANDTPFGLTASLFTSDLDRALSFAREIRAGVVKINQETAGLEYQAPFGGMKASSSGSREQGKVARDFFTEWKTVYVDPSART